MRVVILTSSNNVSSQVILPALLEAKHEVVGVVVELPKKLGWRRKLRWLLKYFGPIHTAKRVLSAPFRQLGNLFGRGTAKGEGETGTIAALASSLGLPGHFTTDHNSAENETLVSSMQPDVGIICGTGRIDRRIFSIPLHGCINFHSGLVPEYRGLETIFWALYNEEYDKVGVTIHFVDDTIDTGDVIFQERIPVSLEDTPETLYDKACKVGARLIAQALDELENRTLEHHPQTPNDPRAKFYRMPTWRQRRELGKKLARRRARLSQQ